MSKIYYLTVQKYIDVWESIIKKRLSEKTVYLRINEDRLFAIKDPGGQGWLIPVCECRSNPFPNKNLCNVCLNEFQQVKTI